MANLNPPALNPPNIRIEILSIAVSQYAKAFGVTNARDLKIMEKGILNNQILKDIYVNYMNDRKVIVARITISIDWDKHYINAWDSKNNFFNLDKSKSIVVQLDSATALIINHATKLRKEYSIHDVNIECSYKYREEIRNDPMKNKDADEYLGLCSTTLKLQLNPEFSKKMEFVIDKMSELKVIVEHN